MIELDKPPTARRFIILDDSTPQVPRHHAVEVDGKIAYVRCAKRCRICEFNLTLSRPYGLVVDWSGEKMRYTTFTVEGA